MKPNVDQKKYADELSDVFMQMEDLKVQASSIIDAAKEAGIDIKALRKIARELVTPPDKLLKQYQAEEQLDIFRDAIDIRGRKGMR